MLVVALGLLLAVGMMLHGKSLPTTAEAPQDLRLGFAGVRRGWQTQRDRRHASLTNWCRSFARKPRIHAALEDGAPDLLYPSAREEMDEAQPAMRSPTETGEAFVLRPRFYRFIGSSGAIIPPADPAHVGGLTADEEKRLTFPRLPQVQQSGYLLGTGREIFEIIATPIISLETGEAIAAFVAGFSVDLDKDASDRAQSGLWVEGRLCFLAPAEPEATGLERFVSGAISRRAGRVRKGLCVAVDGEAQMVFVDRLNPGSNYPPAYEVEIFRLAGSGAKQD